MIDKKKIEQAVVLFLEGIGEDPSRAGLVETPDRIARMCQELFGGLEQTAAEPLSKRFVVDANNMVMEKDITFYSVCEHHLLPFHGNIDWAECMAGLADIGYDGDLTYEIQEFGRYFPNDQKQLVVDYSLKVGKVLVDMYEAAKAAQGK